MTTTTTPIFFNMCLLSYTFFRAFFFLYFQLINFFLHEINWNKTVLSIIVNKIHSIQLSPKTITIPFYHPRHQGTRSLLREILTSSRYHYFNLKYPSKCMISKRQCIFISALYYYTFKATSLSKIRDLWVSFHSVSKALY